MELFVLEILSVDVAKIVFFLNVMLVFFSEQIKVVILQAERR